MLSNCGHDSRGMYSGDAAGDQTGDEWAIVNWYDYPYGGWNYVLHHPDSNIRSTIAQLATEAANNDNIGYDQSERYTFWQQLEKAGYHPKNITTPCEADCSSGVIAIAKAVGLLCGDSSLGNISIYGYTGNLRQILTAVGFEAYSDAKYLTGDSWLYAGDFLLNTENHVCTCITDGDSVKEDSRKFMFSTKSLVPGNQGLDVWRLQMILKARGYYNGDCDRSFGNQTKTALIKFQQKAGLISKGLSTAGNCDYNTWATLLGLERCGNRWVVDSVCKGYNNNKSTLLCQEFMKASGYYNGKLTWNFDEDLRQAVIAFQKAAVKKNSSIVVNGMWDKETARHAMGDG